MQNILLGIAVAAIGLKLLSKNDNFSNSWIENSRNNNNYKNYPPCFNLSTEAQKIYDILASKNMIENEKLF